MKECKSVKALFLLVSNYLRISVLRHMREEDMSGVPYASEVGSFMYEMVCNRLGISDAVGFLSRYMSKPRKEHWTKVKRVLRYFCGTTSYGLCYQGRPILDRVSYIHIFLDAN
jgi:hypothetical protein